MAYPDRLKRTCNIRRYHEADVTKTGDTATNLNFENDCNLVLIVNEEPVPLVYNSISVNIHKDETDMILSCEHSTLNNS